MGFNYTTSNKSCILRRTTGPGMEAPKAGADVYRRKNYNFSKTKYKIDHATRFSGSDMSLGEGKYGRLESVGVGPCAKACYDKPACKGFVYNFKNGFCAGKTSTDISKKVYSQKDVMFFNKVE